MDIVNKMRSFESDHDPDGWPAVTMGQVSALCDEIDRLRAQLEAVQEPVISQPEQDDDIPEGYCLAPKEPTASMLDAGVAMALQVSVHGEGGWSKYLRGLYKQMLSASPTPE